MRTLLWLGLLATLANAQALPDWCRALPRPQFQALPRLPSADPWFEVYQAAAGVDAIYEPHQSEEVISYLILGRTRALLFDTGLGIGDIARVAHALTPLPIVVVNSHTHDDHVGGNWEFTDIWNLPLAFSLKNALGSKADAQAELDPDELCGPLPPHFDRAAYATRPWHAGGVLANGHIFDLGGRQLQVVTTPGHTPDSLALWDATDGWVFSGDTLYPGEIYLYRPETDLDAYERSLQALMALKPRRVFPAHNVPGIDPGILATVAAAMRQVRAGRVTPQPRGAVNIYSFSDFAFRLAR